MQLEVASRMKTKLKKVTPKRLLLLVSTPPSIPVCDVHRSGLASSCRCYIVRAVPKVAGLSKSTRHRQEEASQ